MSETGYTGYICPKCGNTEHFQADYIEAVFWGCDITEDGWDYFDSEGELNFADDTMLKCCKCGYEASWKEFEED